MSRILISEPSLSDTQTTALPQFRLQPAEVVCFNGDADGLCSLKLLQLANGFDSDALLLTGVKRDTMLLRHIALDAAPKTLTAMDIGLKVNWPHIQRLLAQGWTLQWVDHHEPVPNDPIDLTRLYPYVFLDSDMNTCQIVAQLVLHPDPLWMLMGVLGDNMLAKAKQLSVSLGVSQSVFSQLRMGGELLNYNAYGAELADLTVPPLTIWEEWRDCSDPIAWLNDSALFKAIRQTYQSDWANVRAIQPEIPQVYCLPHAAWSRRIIGLFANTLVQQAPDKAWSVLVDKGDGHWLVSLRVPESATVSARRFCQHFPSGSGRASAGGINALPHQDFETFIRAFTQTYL